MDDLDRFLNSRKEPEISDVVNSVLSGGEFDIRKEVNEALAIHATCIGQ